MKVYRVLQYSTTSFTAFVVIKFVQVSNMYNIMNIENRHRINRKIEKVLQIKSYDVAPLFINIHRNAEFTLFESEFGISIFIVTYHLSYCRSPPLIQYLLYFIDKKERIENKYNRKLVKKRSLVIENVYRGFYMLTINEKHLDDIAELIINY